MDQNAHERDREYIANELVVANAHLDLVMRQLDGAGVIDKVPDADLGLTLLKLGDVETAVTQVRQRREDVGAPAPRRDPGLPGLPLEDLLGELRSLFEHQFDGWTPTLGKNRVMKGMQLFPYPSAGGGRRPTLPNANGRPPASATSADAGQGVRVAVLDTPIYPHANLAGRYITAAGSLLPVDGGLRPWSAGHATFVAGLILAQAPAAELRIESVLEADGSTADVWTVARRLIRYAESGVDIMNLSFGCFTIDGRPPLVLERAIGRLTPETVVIAAAGNYGDPDRRAGVDELPKPTTPIWPAAFDDVVAVGALDGEKPAVFNSTGAWVKLMAPGVDLQSTYLTGEVTGHESQGGPEERDTFEGVAQWSGTSFAAAVVTGAIAALTVKGRRTAYEALTLIRERAGQNGIGIRLP